MRIWPKKKEAKALITNNAIAFASPYSSSPRNVDAYIREGYKQNVVIYRCVEEIARAASSVNIFVEQSGEPSEKNPALDLLMRPNITQGWAQFFRQAVSEYLLTGNMFILSTSVTGKPVELWVLQSKRMTVRATEQGRPLEYKYDEKKTYPVDPITGRSQIFHMKKYDPENISIGMSVVEPVALAADTHNAGLQWNAGLLQNGARPSGILKFKDTPAQETLNRIQEFFKKRFQGKYNAGSVPILTNEAEFQELSMNPKDMDFNLTLKETAKYIASAFGVPLPLIDNDAASFNNIEQAKERFWTDTVLPLLDEFLEAFGYWLFPMYGKENYNFAYDKDSIPALESVQARRYERMARVVDSGLLTINEARAELSFDEVEGGDHVLIGAGKAPLDFVTSDQSQEDEAIKGGLMRMGYTQEEIFEITGTRPLSK